MLLNADNSEIEVGTAHHGALPSIKEIVIGQVVKAYVQGFLFYSLEILQFFDAQAPSLAMAFFDFVCVFFWTGLPKL